MLADKEKIYYELLVLRCRKNDSRAQEELIRLFEKRLFYYLRRLVNKEEDAWDLLQETWLKAMNGLSQLQKPEKLPAWLYSIARNAAYSHIRKEISYRNLLEESENEFPEGTSPVEFNEQDIARVHQALLKLSLPHREVLTLFFLQDLSIEEIADLVKIPPGTVKSRIYHAKRMMRDILEKEDCKHD